MTCKMTCSLSSKRWCRACREWVENPCRPGFQAKAAGIEPVEVEQDKPK